MKNEYYKNVCNDDISVYFDKGDKYTVIRYNAIMEMVFVYDHQLQDFFYLARSAKTEREIKHMYQYNTAKYYVAPCKKWSMVHDNKCKNK